MELKEILEHYGYTDVVEIGDRGMCGLMRFLFTTGLVIGMDEISYAGRYCYHTEEEARQALKAWDGKEDPPGNWIKYKGRGGERNRLVS